MINYSMQVSAMKLFCLKASYIGVLLYSLYYLRVKIETAAENLSSSSATSLLASLFCIPEFSFFLLLLLPLTTALHVDLLSAMAPAYFPGSAVAYDYLVQTHILSTDGQGTVLPIDGIQDME